MILVALQVVVAILLVASILLQTQGSGLSASFGGGGEFYRSRRSMEKYLLRGTIVLSIIFALLSIVLLIPHK